MGKLSLEHKYRVHNPEVIEEKKEDPFVSAADSEMKMTDFDARASKIEDESESIRQNSVVIGINNMPNTFT